MITYRHSAGGERVRWWGWCCGAISRRSCGWRISKESRGNLHLIYFGSRVVIVCIHTKHVGPLLPTASSSTKTALRMRPYNASSHRDGSHQSRQCLQRKASLCLANCMRYSTDPLQRTHSIIKPGHQQLTAATTCLWGHRPRGGDSCQS